MIPNGWKAILRHDPDFDGVAVYLMKYEDGKRFIVSPIDLNITEEYDVGMIFPEPTFRFNEPGIATGFLQSLAEGLAMTGFKSKEIELGNRELAATLKHLDDMRAIVEAKLNIVLGIKKA